jgi:hypothetical protein
MGWIKKIKNISAAEWRWIALAIAIWAAGYAVLNHRLLVTTVLYRWAASDYDNSLSNLIGFGFQSIIFLLVLMVSRGLILWLMVGLAFLSGICNSIHEVILGETLGIGAMAWMLEEVRQLPTAVSELGILFAYGIAKVSLAIALLLLARRLLGRVLGTRFLAVQKNWILVLTLILAFSLLDPILGAIKRARAAEMNVYGLAIRALSLSDVEKTPVDVEVRKTSKIDTIVWLIDESIAWSYFEKIFQPDLSRKFPSIDYGRALSMANCSAQSNAALRWGVNVEGVDESTDLRVNPTIWAFASKAGYETMLIDGQVSGAPQNLIWGNEKRLIDKIVPAKSGIDTDKKIAQTLNGLMRDGKRRFVYVVLRGSHYQYASNLPAEEVSPEMSNRDVYERSIAYSKKDFFDTMLHDVNRDQVAIFYTSDHGQYLESGVVPHCNTKSHDEEFYVPLVLFPPLQLTDAFSAKGTGSVVNSHSQIFPTTLYLMGFSSVYAEDRYDNLLPGPSKRLIRFGKKIFPVSSGGGIDVKEVSVE